MDVSKNEIYLHWQNAQTNNEAMHNVDRRPPFELSVEKGLADGFQHLLQTVLHREEEER